MADRTLRIVEGSKVTETFNFRRGGAAFDLTGYTVAIYVHDDKAAKGTNFINGSTVTIDDAVNGVTSYQFIGSQMDFDGDTFNGKIGFRLIGPVDNFYIVHGDIVITRNPFIA